MSEVVLDITMSLDGFVAAPNDVSGRGLGENGEVLHYWVFGGPWTYDSTREFEQVGADRQVFGEATKSGAAGVGRRMYDITGGGGGAPGRSARRGDGAARGGRGAGPGAEIK